MKRLFALILSIVMVALLASCGSSGTNNSVAPSGSSSGEQSSTPAVGTKYKEQVTIGLKAQVTTLDPQEVANTVQAQVMKFSHATLVDLNPVTGEFSGDLAESWNWVDSTTIEFKLRANLKFHNGESVKASDVVFTMNRAKNGKGSSPRVKTFKEVVAVDDSTVRFVLEGANMDMLDVMANPVMSILSEKSITENSEKGYYIGAGPWVVEQFVINDYISFNSFEGYHLTPTVTKKLKVRYIPEESARVIAVQTGEIDLCEDPAPTSLDALKNDKKVKVIQYDSPTNQYFAFNYKTEPGSNKMLRQAIAHAINREEIILGVKSGYGIPGKTYWGINQYGYYDGFKGYEYDVEKAKQMVIDAGYPNGVNLEITVISGERVTTAQIMQAQLKKIGVNVTINEVDSAAMTSIVSEGKHQSCLWGIGFNSAGDDVRRIYYSTSSNNRSHYDNEKVDELINLAVAESNETKRLDYYKQIQEIANEDIPVISLYYDQGFWVAAAGLGGIDWGCSSANDMSFVYVAQ